MSTPASRSSPWRAAPPSVRRPSPPASASPAPTAATRSWWPTRRSTSSTSPRRTMRTPVRAAVAGGGQAHPGGEAAGPQRRRGRAAHRRRAPQRRVLHGGAVDAFLPKFDVLRQLLDDGAPGEVRTVIADNGEHFGPEHRSCGPTWPVAHCSTSAPIRWRWRRRCSARPSRSWPRDSHTERGQRQASIVLSHAGGNQSVLHTTLFSDTPCAAVVAGTEASATIPGPFYMPGDFAWPPTVAARRWTGVRRPSATAPCTTRPPTSPPASAAA